MKKQFLEAGEIVSTHGVQGEVKILPWCDGPEFLQLFDVFYIDGIAHTVEKSRIHKNPCCVSSKELMICLRHRP